MKNRENIMITNDHDIMKHPSRYLDIEWGRA